LTTTDAPAAGNAPAQHGDPDAAGNRFASQEDLRRQIREFVSFHSPPNMRGLEYGKRIAHMQSWAATLYDHGFAGPAWPRAYGGMQLSLAEQVVYHDEFAKHAVPSHSGNGPSIAGPTLLRFGTPEQRRRYLPPMLRGDEVWAQGFSEPSAGSDLQSLTTSARRDGDDYLVRGSKLWSSYADVADLMFALVRTGDRDSGAHGISYLLIDLRRDGVTVRPLRDMSGGSRFCEVFLDDVRVPVVNRVGSENGGWQLARNTLGYERAARSLSHASSYRRRMDHLIKLLQARGALGDAVARDRLARCESAVRVLAFNAARTASALETTGSPGPSASIARLFQSQLEQAFYEAAVDLLGPDALLLSGERAIEGGRWAAGYLHSRGATIGAGTAEIQRNTIAEQILEMPRSGTGGQSS
jgi:alkylation response protein AidB-like acyl-CoA dehydrogenase